jgi:TM2 domain-containing membrane protein YozV
MNCANHPESTATAFCRTCGKALCSLCQRPAQGTVFCDEHAVSEAAGPRASDAASSSAHSYSNSYSPYTAPYVAPPATAGPSPGVAFILGLIPGLGAIYNGQYAKGLIHVVILGLLISIVSSDGTHGLEPIFGMLIPAWVFYMAFEAYHTASKRQRGEPVDEFSSVFPARQVAPGFPVAPLMLIAIGILFLLLNLEIVRLYQVIKYWPVFLIALGAYLLYRRIATPAGYTQSEVRHE